MSATESLPLSDIDVAILVGGLGTRLRGVVDNVPKPLAPVLGRPFLFYLLDRRSSRSALCHALQRLYGRFCSGKNRLRVDGNAYPPFC